MARFWMVRVQYVTLNMNVDWAQCNVECECAAPVLQCRARRQTALPRHDHHGALLLNLTRRLESGPRGLPWALITDAC